MYVEAKTIIEWAKSPLLNQTLYKKRCKGLTRETLKVLKYKVTKRSPIRN